MSKKKKREKTESSQRPPLLPAPPASLLMPTSPLEVANRYTVLGTMPRPVTPSSFAMAVTMPHDPSSNPLGRTRPRFPAPNRAESFQKSHFQSLFYIENIVERDPFQIAFHYFSPGWHWVPRNQEKDLKFFLSILSHTRSIYLKPLYDKVDPSKIFSHSCFIVRILTLDQWGQNPNTIKSIPDTRIRYNYHDYIDAWLHFPFYQTPSMSHSWFFNFDKKFVPKIPLWFIQWWQSFGPIPYIYPPGLQPVLDHIKSVTPKMDSPHSKFPFSIIFVLITNYHGSLIGPMRKLQTFLSADFTLNTGIKPRSLIIF